MWNRPTRREFSGYVLGLLAAGPLAARAQEQGAKKDDEKAAGELPGPPPIPAAKPALLPTLPTHPVRRGSPDYNITCVDPSLLPRDPQNIWVLNFCFKPLRLRTVDVPGKGRRQIHYLYYRVVNRTGQPREFVPQFTLVTSETGKRYEESVLPQAVPLIRGREDPSIPVFGAVEVDGVIPPSTKQAIDDAVYGVALWEGVDPRSDRLSIYVRGLSDGHQEVSTPDGKSVTRFKTLRIDLIRRGDERNLREEEYKLAEPAYEWVYW